MIRVFSGHQWLEVVVEHHNYNVAVCLSALKLAQICYWTKGDSKSCLNENCSLLLPLPSADGFECRVPVQEPSQRA